MNTSTYFRDWLFNIYKPCALVYASEKAKNIINKNNMSPADFLRPLGDFKGRQISYPYSDRENISIPNFSFDFYDNDKFHKIPTDKILQYIFAMYEYNKPDWDLGTPTVNKRTSEPYLSNIKYNSTKWYREYEKTLFECLKFDDYELLQQPFINIFICSCDEPPSIITDELIKSKNTPKLIYEERYDSPKETIIILVNDNNKEKDNNDKVETKNDIDTNNTTSTPENDKDNKNEINEINEKSEKNEINEKNEKSEKKAKSDNNEKEKNEKMNNFKAMYKNAHIIYWDINRSEENDETDKIYRKYLHRTDLYNPDNDFYRKNDIILGKYISVGDIVEYREDFFKYITNTFLNKILEQIYEHNNIIKTKKVGFKFFRSSNKNSDTYYSGTKIYKFTEVERSYYNLGLIHFYLRQYNYSLDNFKYFCKAIKDKSINHRNRNLELSAIIRFLAMCNTKKDYDVEQIKKLPEYELEQEIKLEFLSIKMYENNCGQQITNSFLNLIKNSIYNFIKTQKEKRKKDNSTLTCLDYVTPIFYEKISIYFLKMNKIRNFAIYMAHTGSYFNQLFKEMKLYALYSLSQLLFVIDHPNQSFIDFREHFNECLAKTCNEIKYYEGALKFYRNCLQFSFINDNDNANSRNQNIYFNFYLNNASKIFQEKILCDNININEVCVPLIDNRSLFILEEDDYNIKKTSELIFESERSWRGFLKYNVKLLGDPYNDLDENDLKHVNFVHDISKNLYKTRSNINTKESIFNGNVNKKLYVHFSIQNPIITDLTISSIKLLCEFIPDISDNDNNGNPFICNEKQLTLKKYEKDIISLSVKALAPGKIIVKGLELILFKDCKVIHYFNEKTKKLYSYRKKSSSKEDSSIDINTSGDMNTSDLKNRSFSEKEKNVYSKRIIEYIVKDYSDDLYVSFPMGLNISLYLYEFLLFPIVLTNNSNKNRVKRFTLFIENCNNEKVYNFFNYITKEIHLNKENPTTTIYIPILPIFKDNVYIKLLIKFSDEKRIKPIPAKLYIIKIKVKRSLFFDFKETCYNFFSDKNKKIDVNLKLDLSLRNEELKDFDLKTPIINKKYCLLNKKRNDTNDNKIHTNYYFERNDDYVEEEIKEDSDDDEETKIKKRDYSEVIKNFGFFLCDKDNKNIVDIKNNHIYEKLNEMVTKMKSNAVIFPWKAKFIKENKKEETENEKEGKEGKEENNENKNIIKDENEKIKNNEINSEGRDVKGIFIYELQLKNPNISKNYIRDLFYTSTKLEPIVKKINKEKSLVIINIIINKTGLIPLGKDIEKYDIFIDENTPLITWFGPNRFTVKNHIENESDKIAKCRFSFYTEQKGFIEVNRICVLLYKRFEGMEISTGIIQINHITQPLYLEID